MRRETRGLRWTDVSVWLWALALAVAVVRLRGR
jgi:hypothetical protein